MLYSGELVLCINIVCSCVADNQGINQTCCRMNDCRCHLGSVISQRSDRVASRCLPACLSLRHLLSIAVQGRIVRRTFSAADLCAGRRFFSAADFWQRFFGGFFCGECSWRIFAADVSVDLSRSGGGFCGGFSADLFRPKTM